MFNDSVMQARLPKKIYKELKKTIEEGKELSMEIADVVAHEMKETRVYLSLVREFNKAEYEKYYRAKKKAKMKKRIILAAKVMKYVVPVLVSTVLYNALSQRLYIERGSHEIGSEAFLVGMIGLGIFCFLSWFVGGDEH